MKPIFRLAGNGMAGNFILKYRKIETKCCPVLGGKVSRLKVKEKI